MKKKFLFGGMVLTVLSFACNNSGDSSSSTDTATVHSTDTATTAKVEANPSTVSTADAEFMRSAANAGMTEVAMGNMAVKNSSNDKIKAFGEMMIKDHTAAGNQLKQIAGTKNIQLPDSLSAESRKHAEEMEKMHGKSFDKAYVDMMIDGHKKVLKEFEDIQSNGSDTELKAFVTQTIPVIKGHLDSIQSIKKSMK